MIDIEKEREAFKMWLNAYTENHPYKAFITDKHLVVEELLFCAWQACAKAKQELIDEALANLNDVNDYD